MAARCQSADSTTATAWEAALGGRLADAVITDPPYCILTRRRKGGDERDPKGRKLERGPLRRFEDVRAYRDFTRSWLSLASRHCAPSAPLVVWTNLLGREPIVAVAAELGWTTLRGEFVWAKRTREANSGEELARVVETALVFTRSPAPRPSPADPALPWAVVTPHAEDPDAARWGAHPSHKPFAVLEPLVRSWSRPGQLVVDPFAGSGSIPAACVRLERLCACMELEPEWAERVTTRLGATR